MKNLFILSVFLSIAGCRSGFFRIGTYKYVTKIPTNSQALRAVNVPLDMGITLDANSTYTVFIYKDKLTGTYSIQGNDITFTGPYSRQAPGGHFEGNTLIIHDKTQNGGIAFEKQ